MIIEKTILNHLTAELDVPVVLEREGYSAPFVRFERTAGGRKNRIESATIAFQSYGDSLLEACELNDRVKKAVYGLAALGSICGVELVSDYNFTDSSTKEYRYQALFIIRYLMEE